MRVVAIDPAPKKPSTLYDGQGFRQVPASHMRTTLSGLREHSPLLLCWDAPLTGPQDPDGAGAFCDDFFIRPLDGFLRALPPPEGISVREYAGCPHWTISRSVLGLPRIGPWDAGFDLLPFHLLPGDPSEANGVAVSQLTRPCVVEIHPAVATWLWCKDTPEWKSRTGKRGKEWNYKGSGSDRAIIDRMWEVIVAKCDDSLRSSLKEPRNDDELDAAVGYVLGVKWLRGDKDVVLLGDRETGAMLLPKVDPLQQWAAHRKELAINEERRQQLYSGMTGDHISAKEAATLLGADVNPAIVRELMKEPEKCGHVFASGRGGKRVYTLPPSPTDLSFSPARTPSSGVAE